MVVWSPLCFRQGEGMGFAATRWWRTARPPDFLWWDADWRARAIALLEGPVRPLAFY
jgi:hypothetical protein